MSTSRVRMDPAGGLVMPDQAGPAEGIPLASVATLAQDERLGAELDLVRGPRLIGLRRAAVLVVHGHYAPVLPLEEVQPGDEPFPATRPR